MKKFEYRIEKFPIVSNWSQDKNFDAFEALLTGLSLEGWELISIEGGGAYLKREFS